MQINARFSKASEKGFMFFKSAARKIIWSQYGGSIYICWLQTWPAVQEQKSTVRQAAGRFVNLQRLRASLKDSAWLKFANEFTS
jgi:hypothetical protein